MEQEKKEKKKFGFFKKLTLLLILVFAGFIYYKIHFLSDKKLDSIDIISTENGDSEILEISDKITVDEEAKDDLEENKLTHLTVEKLQKGGAEFTYQLLLYNQVQIEELNKKFDHLERKFARYKSSEKLAKMMLIYVRVRHKIYNEMPYKRDLRSLESLAINDVLLREKIVDLKDSASAFYSYDFLQKEFRKYIPDLIALKKHDENSGFFESLKFKLSKIITIRSLDENSLEIDGAIVKIENSLKENDCKNAISLTEKIESKYREKIANFVDKLRNSCEFEAKDEKVMIYLESLIK